MFLIRGFKATVRPWPERALVTTDVRPAARQGGTTDVAYRRLHAVMVPGRHG